MSPSDNNDAQIASGLTSGSSERPFQYPLVHLLIAVTLIAAGLAVVVPLYRGSREAAERLQCSNHLKQIGLALQNYHDVFGCLPSAWQVDGNGKPAHSWRVAILPFIQANADFVRYNYSEPWNSPNNSKIATRTGFWLYTCRADRNHKPEMTNYVAVVGQKTMWPVSGYMRMADFSNGLSHTIMVVEITNSDIHWMEPRDLPVEELKEWLKPGHKPSLFQSHGRGRLQGGLVVFADGHTELLSHDVTEKRLRALLSPAGNDNKDADENPSAK